MPVEYLADVAHSLNKKIINPAYTVTSSNGHLMLEDVYGTPICRMNPSTALSVFDSASIDQLQWDVLYLAYRAHQPFVY